MWLIRCLSSEPLLLIAVRKCLVCVLLTLIQGFSFAIIAPSPQLDKRFSLKWARICQFQLKKPLKLVSIPPSIDRLKRAVYGFTAHLKSAPLYPPVPIYQIAHFIISCVHIV